ncbi:MAG: CoA-binding protein [Dehalococcoidia bacterium]|nr:CoA-binding protein [Dehalococcoidia bacterium]
MSKAIASTSRNLDRVFCPRSVAVVGDKQALGYMWLKALSDFKGEVYSVQIDPSELPGIAALGVPNYSSLQDIPGPVDYVISSVPRAAAPRIVRDCIEKAVGGVCFFTSGFAETSTEEGTRLQREITELALQAGLNLIGPNCVGVYNPRIGLKHNAAQQSGEGGPVGFIAQSGTHATLFSILGAINGIRISKSVSYGNAVVLDSTDFLEYLGQDDETRIIGMYIEGVRDGRRFLRVLKDVAARKPVLIWKGGQTQAGARATASHTGVLAESAAVWETLIRQYGAVKVHSVDEMIDTAKALLYVKPARGNRVGLIAMSGGQSVTITDTFAGAGLEIPLLDERSYDRLAAFFDIIGGSYRNPFDISSSFFMSANGVSNLASMLDVMEKDPNIDSVVLEMFPLIRPQGAKDTGDKDPVLETLSEFRARSEKPFMVIITTAHEESLSTEARKRVTGQGIACFPNFERAAKALRRHVDYFRLRRELDSCEQAGI